MSFFFLQLDLRIPYWSSFVNFILAIYQKSSQRYFTSFHRSKFLQHIYVLWTTCLQKSLTFSFTGILKGVKTYTFVNNCLKKKNFCFSREKSDSNKKLLKLFKCLKLFSHTLMYEKPKYCNRLSSLFLLYFAFMNFCLSLALKNKQFKGVYANSLPFNTFLFDLNSSERGFEMQIFTIMECFSPEFRVSQWKAAHLLSVVSYKYDNRSGRKMSKLCR